MGSKPAGTVSCRRLYHRPKPSLASFFQGKRALGSCLRVGAISACPMKLAAGLLYFSFRVSSNTSKLLICIGEQDSYPLLSSSIPMAKEFRSVTFHHFTRPPFHAIR